MTYSTLKTWIEAARQRWAALGGVLLLASCALPQLQPQPVDPTLRSPSTEQQDEQLMANLNEIFANDDQLLAARAQALSFNRRVVLYGEAPSAEVRALVEQATRAQPGVEQVYNQIELSPGYSEPDRGADLEVAALVRSRLLFTQGVDLERFVFKVDRRKVYLVGAVSASMQANIANTVAATNGVRSVHVYFELLP